MSYSLVQLGCWQKPTWCNELPHWVMVPLSFSTTWKKSLFGSSLCIRWKLIVCRLIIVCWVIVCRLKMTLCVENYNSVPVQFHFCNFSSLTVSVCKNVKVTNVSNDMIGHVLLCRAFSLVHCFSVVSVTRWLYSIELYYSVQCCTGISVQHTIIPIFRHTNSDGTSSIHKTSSAICSIYSVW